MLSVVKTTFNKTETSCDCYFVPILNSKNKLDIYMKFDNVANFLEFKCHKNAIKLNCLNEWVKTWSELITLNQPPIEHLEKIDKDIVSILEYNPETDIVFINEIGTCALISRSFNPISLDFLNWVYNKHKIILASLLPPSPLQSKYPLKIAKLKLKVKKQKLKKIDYDLKYQSEIIALKNELYDHKIQCNNLLKSTQNETLQFILICYEYYRNNKKIYRIEHNNLMSIDAREKRIAAAAAAATAWSQRQGKYDDDSHDDDDDDGRCWEDTAIEIFRTTTTIDTFSNGHSLWDKFQVIFPNIFYGVKKINANDIVYLNKNEIFDKYHKNLEFTLPLPLSFVSKNTPEINFSQLNFLNVEDAIKRCFTHPSDTREKTIHMLGNKTVWNNILNNLNNVNQYQYYKFKIK